LTALLDRQIQLTEQIAARQAEQINAQHDVAQEAQISELLGDMVNQTADLVMQYERATELRDAERRDLEEKEEFKQIVEAEQLEEQINEDPEPPLNEADTMIRNFNIRAAQFTREQAQRLVQQNEKKFKGMIRDATRTVSTKVARLNKEHRRIRQAD